MKKLSALFALAALALVAGGLLAQDAPGTRESGAPDNAFGKQARYRAATLEETRVAVTRWLAQLPRTLSGERPA